jgi:hypothetical protein
MAAPIYPEGRPGYGDVKPKIITPQERDHLHAL